MNPTKLSLLIEPDGTLSIHPPENGSHYKLKELYALLHCDTIEVLYSPTSRQWCIMDEEAKLKADSLMNEIASVIAWKQFSLSQGDFLLGNILFCDKEFFQ